MPIDELLAAGRIRRQAVSRREIAQVLRLAERDLKTARKIMRDDPDWGFAVAYNAVLQAGRALMFARGYRPASAEGHKNTFAFLLASLGSEHEDVITYFDRMRNKRNQAIYGMAGRVAETEARNLLKQAESFVRLVQGMLSEPR